MGREAKKSLPPEVVIELIKSVPQPLIDEKAERAGKKRLLKAVKEKRQELQQESSN